MPGLGCDSASGPTVGDRVLLELNITGHGFSLVSLSSAAIASDSWGCRIRSGYSTGVYGIGCVLQCSVQCAVQRNEWQTRKTTGVREDGQSTSTTTSLELQVPLDVRAAAAPMTIMTDWPETQTRASSGRVDAARRPQSHAFCTARR
jgi:hypothetical protein